MADFPFLSDTDESAVEEILAEAMDHIVLKQVAAINCASFSHSSVLPANLESRFQRLKTFPSSSNPKPQLVPDSATEFNDSASSKPKPQLGSNSATEFHHDNPNCGDSGEVPGKEMNLEGKSRSGYVTSPSDSSNSSFGHANSPKLKPKSGDGEVKERKSLSGSFSFRSKYSNSSLETAKIGCFWCSPKRVSRKKSGNSNTVAQMGLDWGKHDDILSELKSFSSKEQKKITKEAMKEKEKINKEAEKIVKWAKQASARLDFSDIDDALSDGDSGHNFGFN